MPTKHVIILIIVAVVSLTILTLLSKPKDEALSVPTGTTFQVYKNSVYDYSFLYPAQYEIREFTGEYVGIGNSKADEFNVAAAATVVKSGPKTDYKKFDDFLIAQGQVLCAAKSMEGTTDCSKTEMRENFVSESGLTGDTILFKLLRKNPETNETATSTFGPVYAFDISDADPDSKFAALLIYRPIMTDAQAVPNSVIEKISRSLEF